jgi:hypothetical protein
LRIGEVVELAVIGAQETWGYQKWK